LLVDHGVDLSVLDARLREYGDAGLAVTVAARTFEQWRQTQWPRVAAVLAESIDAEQAKGIARDVRMPSDRRLDLAPAMVDLVQPFAAVLRDAGRHPDATELATRPDVELVRISACGTLQELEHQVRLIFDDEERRRVLAGRVARWRSELRVVAVLCRMGPNETRATVRTLDLKVETMLQGRTTASQLVDLLDELLPNCPRVVAYTVGQLTESITAAPPDRSALLAAARDDGVDVDRLALLTKALDGPRSDHARAVARRAEQLREQAVAPRRPPGLTAPAVLQRPPRARKDVPRIKIDGSADRRKKQLGDEGEQWALASVIATITQLSAAERSVALDAIVALLDGYAGDVVQDVLSHADLARDDGIDDEALIDELSSLLHVSRHSDAFGFDMIGWLAPTPEHPPIAMCLEVKSSSTGAFNLSSGEWAGATRYHERDQGFHYAVLVVRRDADGGPPAHLDLLVDPVELVASGQLRQDVDGFRMAYVGA
jgi:hypothetical protein